MILYIYIIYDINYTLYIHNNGAAGTAVLEFLSHQGSFCLCYTTCVHLFLHLFKQLSPASPFLPPQCYLRGINRFAVAAQDPWLGLCCTQKGNWTINQKP